MLTPEQLSRLRRLMELREARDEAKSKLTKAEAEYRDAEGDLFDELTDPETGAPGKIPFVDLGPPWGRVAFSSRETYYGRVIDEDEALEYFRARHMERDVASPKFKMKRINEIVRASVENGEAPPPGLDFYANRGVTITRQKS